MAKIPEQVGKYKILSLLGSGGTSIVYLGLHPTLKRKVVLKKLNLRGKKSFYERFLQEAALMMDLNHDNIVKVYDHFKEGSRHYMVMEFVEGASLDRIVEETGPLAPDTVRYVLRCCARALEYIHERNIIHRDIKPSNIFISSEGKVKLGDFGIAMLEEPGGADVERPILGTPSYMAPEQFSTRGRITPRTDIYALGVSCYELLTGLKLFDGDSLEELREAVLRGHHAPLLSLWRRFGFILWRVVRRSVSRFPLLRYPDAASYFRALRSFRANDRASEEDLSLRIGLLPPPGAGKHQMPGRGGGRPLPPPGLSGLLEPPARPLPVKRILFVFMVLLFLGGTAASVKSGLFFRLFMADRMGAFTVKVGSEERTGLSTAGTMEIYREKDGKLKTLGEEMLDQDEADIHYRASGFYRVRMEWGNRIQWKSFYLPPLSREKNGVVLLFQAPPIRQNPLRLTVRLTDAFSTAEIPNAAETVSLAAEGEWKPLAGGALLLSGHPYLLRFAVPGYCETVLELNTDFYEDEVVLDIALMPQSGSLSVGHNLEKLSLRVNGKKRLRREDGTINRFGLLDMEGEKWNLRPGVYQLHWSGDGWSEDQKLTIRGGETVLYRITSGLDGKPRFEINRKQ